MESAGEDDGDGVDGDGKLSLKIERKNFSLVLGKAGDGAILRETTKFGSAQAFLGWEQINWLGRLLVERSKVLGCQSVSSFGLKKRRVVVEEHRNKEGVFLMIWVWFSGFRRLICLPPGPERSGWCAMGMMLLKSFDKGNGELMKKVEEKVLLADKDLAWIRKGDATIERDRSSSVEDLRIYDWQAGNVESFLTKLLDLSPNAGVTDFSKHYLIWKSVRCENSQMGYVVVKEGMIPVGSTEKIMEIDGVNGAVSAGVDGNLAGSGGEDEDNGGFNRGILENEERIRSSQLSVLLGGNGDDPEIQNLNLENHISCDSQSQPHVTFYSSVCGAGLECYGTGGSNCLQVTDGDIQDFTGVDFHGGAECNNGVRDSIGGSVSDKTDDGLHCGTVGNKGGLDFVMIDRDLACGDRFQGVQRVELKIDDDGSRGSRPITEVHPVRNRARHKRPHHKFLSFLHAMGSQNSKKGWARPKHGFDEYLKAIRIAEAVFKSNKVVGDRKKGRGSYFASSDEDEVLVNVRSLIGITKVPLSLSSDVSNVSGVKGSSSSSGDKVGCCFYFPPFFPEAGFVPFNRDLEYVSVGNMSFRNGLSSMMKLVDASLCGVRKGITGFCIPMEGLLWLSGVIGEVMGQNCGSSGITRKWRKEDKWIKCIECVESKDRSLIFLVGKGKLHQSYKVHQGVDGCSWVYLRRYLDFKCSQSGTSIDGGP